VSFFVRIAALGKILTHDNQRKHNIVVVDWCYMCMKSGESIDHLLLQYDVAQDILSFFYILFGVEWLYRDECWIC